jgi:hypothetical protein
MLSVIMLEGLMLSAIMLKVLMLSVVAPFSWLDILIRRKAPLNILKRNNPKTSDQGETDVSHKLKLILSSFIEHLPLGLRSSTIKLFTSVTDSIS